MDDAALGVDDAAARGGHEAHPGGPAAIVVERAGDRGAKPCETTASGLRNSSSSPDARAAPALHPAAKPRLAPGSIRAGAGSELANRLGGPVGGRVVDDDQLVVLAELLDERRQQAPHRLPAVVGHDHDRVFAHPASIQTG